MTSADDLVTNLRRLGFKAEPAKLAALLDEHRKDTPEEVLPALVVLEQVERARHSLEQRHKRARVGTFKSIADFDGAFPKDIDRARVTRALQLHFIREGLNIVILGNHGVGKTMLAKNISHNAVLAGHRVVFTSVKKMLADITATDSRRRVQARLRHYARVDLLVADELGYLSYEDSAADLLFQLVNVRYEAQKPLVITTNLAFKDWGTVFPNATCTVALIDRLTHRADILRIEGPSWRHKEAMDRDRSRT